MRRIGIYSGTFDPLHAGHLAFARHSLSQCRLDMLLFMPEPLPRHKTDVSDVYVRRHDIETALKTEPAMNVFSLDEPTFTIRTTLPVLYSAFPDAAFTFLIGSDVAIKLSEWKDLDRLLPVAEFAIGMRDSQSIQDVKDAIDTIEQLHAIQFQYHIITTTKSGEASSHYK